MKYANEIPHLAVYKQQVRLPIVNTRTPNIGNVLFLNGKDRNLIDNIWSNRLLGRNNKYLNYYYDSIYRGKVYKVYRENLKQYRRDEYKAFKKKYISMHCYEHLDMLADKNVIVDLWKYNEIFFNSTKSMPKTRKVQAYLDWIFKLINDEKYNSYKGRCVLINFDDWFKNNKNIITLFDNPITIFYLAMYKYYESFKNLGDINFIIYNKSLILRLNPSECDETSYTVFKRMIVKFSNKLEILNDPKKLDDINKKEDIAIELTKTILKSYNITGEDGEENPEITKLINDVLDSKEIGNKKETEEELLSDTELSREIYAKIHEQQEKKTVAMTARDKKLREEMRQLKIANMTVSDCIEGVKKEHIIPKRDIANKVSTINNSMTTTSFNNFDKTYNEKLYKQDIVNMFADLENKSLPVFIRDVQVTPNSDKLNLKETWSFQLEDSNRVRHNVKFDMPVIIEDSILYLNGNKFKLVKQQFPKPIFKSGPDTVQIVSDYNKVFVRRSGEKLTEQIEKFKKLINMEPKIHCELGRCIDNNKDYITSIEFDELAKNYISITVEGTKYIFDQKIIRQEIKDKGLTFNKDSLPVSISNGKVIQFNPDKQDIINIIINNMSENLRTKFNNISAGKKFAFSTATIMGKKTPLVLLVSYYIGLSDTLNRSGIKHYFSTKRPEDEEGKKVIKFKNMYLVYDVDPIENTFLLNAFYNVPTENFDYEEFDTKDIYLDLFENIYGIRGVGLAFNNYLNFMIDSTARDILEKLDLPNNFPDVLLYANKLLADNQYTDENDLNAYRARGNELIISHLYKKLADAYAKMENSNYLGKKQKLTLPKDAVIKAITTSVNIEPYSCLNPITDMEKNRAITKKGPSGQNLEQSYTMAARGYDKSMIGNMTLSTSPDGNCGVVRQLTLEPNIINARGFFADKSNELDDLKDANLFGPSELTTPLGASRDDSIRISMQMKQAKHTVPIENSSPVLISNGSECIVPYHVTNEFSIIAEDDGEVVEVNDNLGLTVVKYKNAKHKAIDTKPRVVKNSSGGFLLTNKLQCNLKVGQKIKKDDILAQDEKFFTDDLFGVRMNIGTLEKVAIHSSQATFEDDAMVTNKVCDDMISYVDMQKVVKIGKNANVSHIVKVGDKVEVGDSLIEFEESFDEDSLNAFLFSVGEELQEEIKTLGKKGVKSKYIGVIEDIQIYTDLPLEELSPSLAKIVKGRYDEASKRIKMLNKYDKDHSIYKCGLLLTEPTSEIDTTESFGKIKGEECVDSVLIYFTIKYRDRLAKGDKITMFGPMKGIVGYIIPKGYEPYTLGKPEEEVSSFLSQNAVIARQTPSILTTLFGNKVLVGLKDQLEEIYNS